MSDIFKVGSGRLWVTKFGAAPDRAPVYLARSMAGSPDWSLGDVTKIESPDDTAYNQWDIVGEFQTSADRPTISMTMYDVTDKSLFKELIRVRCIVDIEIHKGNCEDPRDYDYGYQKIDAYPGALLTNFTAPDQGALDGGNQESLTEEVSVSARTIQEIVPMTYREVAKAEVGEAVVAIGVGDSINCGDCGDGTASDGCQRIFALTDGSVSSPGVLPQLIVTTDQYGDNAIIERWITSATLGEVASDGAPVGPNYVMVSSAGEELHYANITDITNSAETWAAVATGIVAGAGPTAIYSYSSLISYLAGLSGYVYFMANPADGVTVLDAGSATTEDLNDIDGFDNENVAAVGDAGAVVYTTDGANFSLMTGPVGPTDLYAVAYRTDREIWVGGDDGKLYWTRDYGVNWSSKSLSGASTQVDKIIWLNSRVGFAATRTAAPAGRLFMTTNGGYTWRVEPQTGTLPAADYFNDLAVCTKDANHLFVGGLADNAADGVILKGA